MRKLMLLLGSISSFIFPECLSIQFKRIYNAFYTGRKKNLFKKFEGRITGHVTIKGGKYITVGKETLLEEGVTMMAIDNHGKLYSPEITIGNDSKIARNCFLSSINHITIGDKVAIANNCVIIDNVHGDFRPGHMSFEINEDIPDVFLQDMFARELSSPGGVIIEDASYIGMYCMIMPGVTIGHHSVVNAHSVVTKSIPPYSIVSGNPAKVVLTFTEN